MQDIDINIRVKIAAGIAELAQLSNDQVCFLGGREEEILQDEFLHTHSNFVSINSAKIQKSDKKMA